MNTDANETAGDGKADFGVPQAKQDADGKGLELTYQSISLDSAHKTEQESTVENESTDIEQSQNSAKKSKESETKIEEKNEK